ncbi:MAG: acid-resistance rane protein [Gemmataceae bacterium]|nr:acid-resistance rane protein [Gemmataceae bacterium]
MSPDTRFDRSSEDAAAEAVRRTWGWLMALGIMQIVAGTIAVLMSVAATLATMIVLGILALIGAGAEIASVFWSRRWEEGLVHLVIGMLYGAFGILVLAHPGLAAVTLTLILAVMLIAGGLFRVVLAAASRFHGWGWVVLGGVVSVLLGGLIWANWPEASLWVIGLFVGIDLIFLGWKWVAIALAIRGVTPRPAYPRDVPPVVPAG